MSPSYLAVLVRCLGVLSWRNAWSDYGYMFCVSRFHGAVLGLVVDMSVGVQQQGFGQTVEKTVGSAVAFLVSGRCPWLAGRAGSLVQVWRRLSSPTDAACPHVFLEEELPRMVPRMIPGTRAWDAEGHEWSRVVGPAGVYWWRIGTSIAQWTHPGGDHRQARAG